MSFLNPVNETVLRFSSTDADAPQINYNSRVAGDVKAVLKSCLVTGYGAKASAGWSITNDASNIAEFVSPSAAMSDYVFGIDDSKSANASLYFLYKTARTGIYGSELFRAFSNADKSNVKNGWELLVTDRGLYFIEIIYATAVANTVTRVTWFGQVKSALTANTGINISHFKASYNLDYSPHHLFTPNNIYYKRYYLDGYDRADFQATNLGAMFNEVKQYGVSVLNTISEVFLSTSGLVIGKQPGLLLHDVNSIDDLFGVKDVDVDGRPALSITVSQQSSTKSIVEQKAIVLLLRTDYWEF